MICPSCKALNDDSAEACFTCGRALSALTQGSVIAGRYEVLSPLGKGGMGMVYKAHDRMLDETVAIKVLRSEFANTAEMLKRFKHEIKLARKVSHRNVCRIHEFGEDGGVRYISMEYSTIPSADENVTGVDKNGDQVTVFYVTNNNYAKSQMAPAGPGTGSGDVLTSGDIASRQSVREEASAKSFANDAADAVQAGLDFNPITPGLGHKLQLDKLRFSMPTLQDRVQQSILEDYQSSAHGAFLAAATAAPIGFSGIGSSARLAFEKAPGLSGAAGLGGGEWKILRSSGSVGPRMTRRQSLAEKSQAKQALQWDVFNAGR